MNRLKKQIFPLFLLLVLIFPFIFAFPASAQTPVPVPTGTWYRPSLNQFRQKIAGSPEDELFGERYTFAQVNWIIHSLSVILEFDLTNQAFLDALRSHLGQNSTSPSSLADYANLGPAGFLIATMADVYSTPPASGIQSISSTLTRFNLASPVYAQGGYGYTNLTGIQGLWTAARNTAYLIIALLFVVAGFMVILRTKISPQAVVTIQLLIPRLVLTLILVTLSYAIAGLIIDLTYFLVALFLSALAAAHVASNLSLALNFFATPGFYKILLMYLFIWLTFTLDPQSILNILPSILGLLMIVVVLILLLRVWWMMMKSYITLLLLIIAGPWLIMLGILPGRSGFSSWFRNVLAQVSVFAVVPIMVVIGLSLSTPSFSLLTLFTSLYTFITTYFVYGSFSGAGLSPTSQLPSFPLFSAPTSNFFTFLVNLAILALLPKVAEMVRDALKAPKFPYGSAFGEALGPVASPLSGVFLSRGKENLEQGAASGEWLRQIKGGVQQAVGQAIKSSP
jgi:hypothetical protein